VTDCCRLLLQIGESSAAGAERETYEEAHARYDALQTATMAPARINGAGSKQTACQIEQLLTMLTLCVDPCRVQVLSQYAHWDIPVIGQVGHLSLRAAKGLLQQVSALRQSNAARTFQHS
jgi:hypothetical protein